MSVHMARVEGSKNNAEDRKSPRRHKCEKLRLTDLKPKGMMMGKSQIWQTYSQNTTIFITATGGTLSYQQLHVSASILTIVIESTLYLYSQN